MLSKSLSNSKAQIFTLQEQITVFLSKNVLIVMFLILINKNVFEPSYNDLKFRLKPQLLLYQPNITSLQLLMKLVFLQI